MSLSAVFPSKPAHARSMDSGGNLSIGNTPSSPLRPSCTRRKRFSTSRFSQSSTVSSSPAMKTRPFRLRLKAIKHSACPTHASLNDITFRHQQSDDDEES